MTEKLTPEELADIKAKAQRQATAYRTMVELGFGVGLLGVKHRDMYEDMSAWDDATENEHADMVLSLIADVERLHSQLDAADRQIEARSGKTAGERLMQARAKQADRERDAAVAERDGLAAVVEQVRQVVTEAEANALLQPPEALQLASTVHNAIIAAPSAALAHLKAETLGAEPSEAEIEAAARVFDEGAVEDSADYPLQYEQAMSLALQALNAAHAARIESEASHE